MLVKALRGLVGPGITCTCCGYDRLFLDPSERALVYLALLSRTSVDPAFFSSKTSQEATKK